MVNRHLIYPVKAVQMVFGGEKRAILNRPPTSDELQTMQRFRARFAMLAEKFILVLEARIRNGQYLDGSERVHGNQPALNDRGSHRRYGIIRQLLLADRLFRSPRPQSANPSQVS